MLWRSSLKDDIRVGARRAPTGALRRPALRLLPAAIALLTAVAGVAATTVVFGPQTYRRNEGQPVTVTKTFKVTHPAPQYTLSVTNHGVTSANVWLNGVRILEPNDFHSRRDCRDDDHDDRRNGDNNDGRRFDDHDDDVPAHIERTVTLRDGNNQIAVELHGKPGTSLSIQIATTAVTDTTPPTITAAISPAPNAQGWNNTNVTVTFTCSDSGSGIATCPAPVTVTTETVDQAVSGTATDKAGNSAVATVHVKLDKTAPVVAATRAPAANANGWNNAPVVVTFTATDALSGVAGGSLTSPITLATDGSNLSATGRATDLAGNVGTATLTGVNIDRSVPTITASLSPSPNPQGWFTGPVTVHFTCSDGGSGIQVCPADTIVTAEGTRTVSGTATDRAGNTATATSAAIKIDLSAPTITVGLSPAPNANGWNNTPVTAHFTCSDSGAGIATCPPDQVVVNDAANQTVSGTAVDAAGRTASITSPPFNIDQSKPVILVTISPSPNPNGWFTGPVTAHFVCGDALSGVAVCPADQDVTTEGIQAVSGTVTDVAGNSASVTSDPVKIDLGPPVITATLSPAPNANGWNNTPVTVHFTCSDAGAGIDTCPPDQVVSTDGFNQSATGTAIDLAGNRAVVFQTVSIDRTAPTLLFTAPADGATLQTPTVLAISAVSDDLSGLARVTCNGAPATVSAGTVSCDVTLERGQNSIAVIATDLAGNSTSIAHGVIYTRTPVVRITSPDNVGYLNISPTTVTGTVDDPTAAVTINSIPATTGNGSFSIALPLAEGPNIITASATSQEGAVGTASITVTLDTTPPHVTVTSPPDQFVTTEGSITVAGNVNDIVVGTVNDQQAQVTVNGVNATVANRTFVLTDVPLTIGPNVIQVVGRDRVGNQATNQITVTRRVLTQAQIHLVSGNNQSAAIGARVPAPLVIALSDASGNPAANQTVIFKVAQNDGTVVAGGAPGSSVLATTDAQGHASAIWTLGHRAGAGGNSVEAYTVGFEGVAIFTASGTQGAAGKIVVDAGNDQIGLIAQPLPKPLIAVVVDAGNNRLGGVPVIFNVLEGGGSFDGQSSTQVVTDSDGRAEATLTLGTQEGNANNFVQANFDGNQSFAASFSASGRAPGNPADTLISGVVLDNSNAPIPGVTVRALLTNVLHSNLGAAQTAPSAVTDAQGQFSIAAAPVGFVKLLVDGTTAPGNYPSLEYDMVTVSGQNNTVGQPVYLVTLNADNQLCVDPSDPSKPGGTLTIPEAPGFSLTFAAGQVTFPGGSQAGCVSVTVVNGDKVPMVPGFGQQPRFIVTIQPSGAVFNPPAAITLPNVDGLAPREVTEMYSFDHDIGSFVAIGTGVVSDDGLIIRSSPGVGVLKAGWHCGGNPSPTGAAADCPVCQVCTTDHCEADPSQNGQTLPDDKCKICKDGSPTDIDLDKTGVELEYKFGPPSPTVDKINEALEPLKNIGVIAEVHLLQITGKLETKQCCEPENGKGAGNEITGSVTGDFGSLKLKGKIWPLGPIPSFSIKIDIFGLATIEAKGEFVGGVFIGGEAKVTGQLGYRKKECSKDPADQEGCVFGKLEIGVEPSISAEIGGEASVTFDCFLFCDKTTIAAAASFVAGNLSWPISIAGIQYNNESCSSGLTGGFLNFGDGKFKVTVSFSGSVKTDSAGLKEFKETFTFVDCTIKSSGVTCEFGF